MNAFENLGDPEFLASFEDCRIGHADWTHRCHVRLAWLALEGRSLPEAIGFARAGIQRLNASHGTPESLERGYHETVTAAWIQIVAAIRQHYGAGADSRAFCDAQPQLLSSKLLRLYYSRARIISAEAKRTFVAPDLAPLPRT